jgi:hypothetical protein
MRNFSRDESDLFRPITYPYHVSVETTDGSNTSARNCCSWISLHVTPDQMLSLSDLADQVGVRSAAIK